MGFIRLIAMASLTLLGCQPLLAYSSSVGAPLAKTPPSSLHQAKIPIRIPAQHFSTFFGQSVDQVQVVSIDKLGALTRLPVQWTQLTDEGTVASSEYKKIPQTGESATLDAYDLLEVMYADVGGQPCLETLPEIPQSGPAPVQIKVQASGSSESAQLKDSDRYLCLLSAENKSLPLQTRDYVSYDKVQATAISQSYKLFFDKENPLIWHDFYYQGVNLNKNGQPVGESILDSLKINLYAGILSESNTVHLDNSAFDTEVLEARNGPVYDSMFALTKVKMAGATVLKIQVMMHFYPDHVEMVARFKIPTVAKMIVKSPRVDVSLDANNAWGSQILTSWGGSTPLTVDGQMDAQERALTEQQTSGQNTWVWFSTPKGFDLFAFVEFDEDYKVPIALVYHDDRDMKILPERFKGQGPNVGYSIRGMVIGRYFTFKTHLLFSETVAPDQVATTIADLQAPWLFSTEHSSKPQFTKPQLAADKND